VSDYFERVERQLVERVQTGATHRWRLAPRLGQLVPVAAALVVVAVVAVFLAVRGPSPSGLPANGTSSTIALSASALDPQVRLEQSIQRSLEVLRHRFHSALRGIRVTRSADGVTIVVPPGATAAVRAEINALLAPGRLTLYDWEGSVLLPDGRTVASQLRALAQGPSALKISQGAGSAAPGSAGAGAMTLYQAVRLAARQPATGSSGGTQTTTYYLFGAPGSAACASAAREQATAFPPDFHCLLSGPAGTRADVLNDLPRGVGTVGAQELAVPSSAVVLQAEAPQTGPSPSTGSPSARFFVLANRPQLTNADVVGPRPITTPSGGADVLGRLTAAGGRAFQRVTRELARRGLTVSGTGLTLNQHFAFAVDGRLVNVPSIDFKAYPDGVSTQGGIDLVDGLTSRSAAELATLLRFGPLSVSLTGR
jgi:hypothetical protein